MIFDQLWWAERRASKEDKRIGDKYDPIIEAAKKEKNDFDYQSALSAAIHESQLNDGPEVIRTERIIRQARKLGIPLPPKPDKLSHLDADPNWNFWSLNEHNGHWYFTENKELELRQQIRKESDERFAHFWNRFGGFLSALTFVVLLANAIIYYRQANIMATQAEIMQKTLPIVGLQADAATSAASTAAATLQESQKSFRLDQRPYLVVDSVPQFVNPPALPEKPITASVTFKDIGRTPAIRVVDNIYLQPYHANKSTSQLFQFLEHSFSELRKKDMSARNSRYAEAARRDVAPTATFFSTAESISLSQIEMTDLGAGQGKVDLFYLGFVTYTDAFNEKYETEFCYFYVGKDPTTWHICDSHNIIK